MSKIPAREFQNIPGASSKGLGRGMRLMSTNKARVAAPPGGKGGQKIKQEKETRARSLRK